MKNHIYCISSTDYLPFAKNVSETFLLHNPLYTFHVFIVNRSEKNNIDFCDERVQVHYVDDLGIGQLKDMQKRYTVFEYCNSLKPFMASWLFDNFSIEHLIYTDSDMMFFGKVEAVEELLKTSNIILTPHVISPIAIDGKGYAENGFLNAGLYNAGFFAINNSKTSYEFLKWWMERLEVFCKVDFARGFFADQIWLNLVPLFFPEVHILRDPSYNMGAWNLTERKFTNDNYLINDRFPLVCYHFGGFDINKPDEICRYQNRYTFNDRKELLQLYKLYIERLAKFGLYPSIPNENIPKYNLSKKLFLLNKVKSGLKNLFTKAKAV